MHKICLCLFTYNTNPVQSNQLHFSSTFMAARAFKKEDTRLMGSNEAKTTTPDEVKRKPRTDKYIWGIYIALVFISLIELYSASSREVKVGHIFTPLIRHAVLLGCGCLIMVGLQRVRYQVFYKLTWFIVGVSIVAAIYTLFNGEDINNAKRSFSVGFFNVQPSELLKFSAALLIAKVLGDNQIRVNGRPEVKNKGVIIVAAVVLIFSGLIVNQGLTNTLLLMAISLSMMLIGGVSIKQFMMVLATYVILGVCYFTYSSIKADAAAKAPQTEQVSVESRSDRTKMRFDRIIHFFSSDRYTDSITSENRQEQYSYIAQANGGVVGVGVGNSRETARLPLAFSDYIFAIVVEDIGFAGGLLVLILYLLLLARAGAVGGSLRKAFPTLLIIGMAVFIVFQALFHMAIVTGVFPVSGQPLPFISKGGSSVIISSVALGIMLSVSRNAARRKDPAYIEEEETNFADNPY